MIRSLNPADLAVLLLFLGKSPLNGAKTRDRFNSSGEGLLSYAPLIASCLIPQDGRHNLIYARHGLIQGLVSLKRRGGPSAWEVERLLLTLDFEDFCIDLLEGLGSARDEVGMERLFLRLESDSLLVDIAKQAGFRHSHIERLYKLDRISLAKPEDVSPNIRPKNKEDEFALFRLYSSAVPVQIRNVEGMTFNEWLESKERAVRNEFVLVRENEISAWIRIRNERMAAQFDIVAASESVDYQILVDSNLSILRNKYPIYCLVMDYQEQLQRVIEDQGFQQVEEYTCLNKHLAVRAREPKLVPMQA